MKESKKKKHNPQNKKFHMTDTYLGTYEDASFFQFLVTSTSEEWIKWKIEKIINNKETDLLISVDAWNK